MITAGIIAEYNPFHRGHQYHIEETRRQTGADYILVIMSGDYVQRGEPAVTDKYLRTRLALMGGADLVVELPVIYASASAEYFAAAGVKLLHQLRCVDYLSFGSEKAGVEDFKPFVKILSEEPPFYRRQLRAALKTGKNFPLAREEALMECAGREYQEEGLLWDIVRKPNHILGLEYLKALRRLDSSIVPVTVRRQGAGYHDENIRQPFPSASAIRSTLRRDGSEQEEPDTFADAAEERLVSAGMARKDSLSAAMGEEIAGTFLSAWQAGETVSWEDLLPFLSYAVTMEEESPDDFFGFDRDMAARFQKMYRPGLSFSELTKRMHTKRLTDAAIRRALLHRVLHIKKEEYLRQAAEAPVPYARVLGFARRAAPLLKRMREQATIPVLQRPAEGKRFPEGSPAAGMFAADIRAAQLYEQIAAGRSGRKPVSEWTRQQIIV